MKQVEQRLEQGGRDVDDLGSADGPSARAAALWDSSHAPAVRQLRQVARRADEAAQLAANRSDDLRATAYRAGFAHAHARLGIYRNDEPAGGTATAAPVAPVKTAKSRAVTTKDAVDTIVSALAMPNPQARPFESATMSSAPRSRLRRCRLAAA